MNHLIKVNLKSKILTIYTPGGSPVVRFPIIAGRNSHRGSKKEEGDQRTPLGTYYVCTINESSKFTFFFGLSYPGGDDAEKAFRDGRINEEQLNRIIEAHKNKRRPPWDTPLGGEIGIHGGGIDRDGTRGCIGMRDEDVLAIRKYITIGTLVQII